MPIQNRPIKFRIWDEKYHAWVKGLMVYAENIISQGMIFQQFTGLKDKNHKEIYEGDIVKYIEGVELGDKENLTAIVMYDKDYAAFGLGRNEEIGCWNYFTDGTVGHFEVIGNIFENPALLNETR